MYPWHSLLVPQDSEQLSFLCSNHLSSHCEEIPFYKIEIDHNDVPLPECISRRSLNRAGILLNNIVMPSKDLLSRYLVSDPFCVGIYAALESGNCSLEDAYKISRYPDEEFGIRYLEFVHPKTQFYILPSVQVGQVAIQLGSLGRLMTFTHSTLASRMAIDQAMFDLKNKIVRAALICGAFGIDNPLTLLQKSKRLRVGEILCEGAAAIVITEDDHHLLPIKEKIVNRNFGCINDLVHFIHGVQNA